MTGGKGRNKRGNAGERGAAVEEQASDAATATTEELEQAHRSP